MPITKVRLNMQALGKLTQPLIEQTTREIAGRAGEGFVGDVIWTDRPHGAVRATTFKAKRDNAKNNTLLKAVQG